MVSYFFLRAAAVLVAGIVLVALLLDLLLLQFTGTNDMPGADYRAEFALIEALLAESGGTAAAFAEKQPGIEAALGTPVSLHRPEEFAGLGEELAALAAGDIVTLYDAGDNALHYKRLAGGDLLAIGPVPAPPAGGVNPRLVSAAYYLLIGLLVLLWIRPFYLDLDRLRAAALKFGANDFSARVQVGQESRILPVARAFNAMAERIEYLVSSHRELTNAVSHELRTPLARFRFSMEILARTADAKKKEDYLAAMKRDVEELEGLIDEMLNYAKLNEQNLLLELVEMDVKPWLQELVDAYKDEPVRITLAVTPAGQQAFRATFNPQLMARAVNNILRNCLRYADSRITVTLSQANDVTEIRIEDDGKGIAEDKLPTLFDPFTRGDTSRDRQSGGYGLGLAIAARIVQRHNGTIAASNRKPHGACFTLAWPACAAPV